MRHFGAHTPAPQRRRRFAQAQGSPALPTGVQYGGGAGLRLRRWEADGVGRRVNVDDLQNFLGDGRRGDGGGAAAAGSFVVVVAAAGGEAEGQEKEDYDDEGSDEDSDDDPETEAEDGSAFGKLCVDESCVVH